MPLGGDLDPLLGGTWQCIPSAEQARFALAKWSDHFGGATVADLTPQAQEAFVAALRANGYQPSYISRSIRRPRRVDAGLEARRASSVPFIADVKRDPEHEAERFRDLSMDEVARLLRAAAAIPPVEVLHD